MTTKQTLDELPAEDVPAAEAPAGAREVRSTGADMRAVQSDLKRTKAALDAQPKVTVKVQEDTVVQINGYGFLIKGKTKVAVPEQVADILEEAGRI